MAVKALMTDETGKQIVDAIREKAGLEARVSDLEKNKVDKSSISQTTGDAEDKVMSQRAVTEELEKKFDKSNVVQSTGDAEDKVMSQAAATEEFNKLSEEIDGLNSEFYGENLTNEVVYNEKSYNHNYVTLPSPLLVGTNYRIAVSLSGFTSAQIAQYRGYVQLYNSNSSQGFIEQIDLPIKANDTEYDFEYTPTSNVTYVRLAFNSAYSSEANTSTWKTYEITRPIHDAIARNAKAIAEIPKSGDIVHIERDYNLIPSDIEYTNSAEVNFFSGNITSVDKATSVTDFIPIDASQEYICNFSRVRVRAYDRHTDTYDESYHQPFARMNMAFYDANKMFVATESANTDVSKKIPVTAKYIRVTVNTDDIPYARLIYGHFTENPVLRQVEYREYPEKPYVEANTGYENFKMVMFGDSITHGDIGAENGTSYCDYAGDYLHADIISVGFGGTRMLYSLSGAGLFCFYHLCECIVSDDESVWTPLEDFAANENESYLPHLETLKNIDWSTVNAIGLMYGANDFTSNTPVGNEYSTDTSTYDGACAYGLSLLLAKYPHLQVIILTPFYRQLTEGDETTGTDGTPNSIGLFMKDYGESLKNVQSIFHCPVIDTEAEFCINKFNYRYMIPDGTHPYNDNAQKRLGHCFANIIKRYISPV